MKATYINYNSFRPVVIQFTFETQAELDAIGALFNHGPISDALHDVFKVDIGDVYKAFVNARANISVGPLVDALRRRIHE